MIFDFVVWWGGSVIFFGGCYVFVEGGYVGMFFVEFMLVDFGLVLGGEGELMFLYFDIWFIE